MIPKPDLIQLSRIAPFLAHQGGRLGKLDDPPGPYFCVEGGVYEGVAYGGVVLEPPAPSSGSTRTDAVIAHVASGTIALVLGTEGFGPPDVSAYTGSPVIAEVTVQGHPSGKVLIRQEDILDRRSLLQPPARSTGFTLVDQVIFAVGGRNGAPHGLSNAEIINVGDTVGPFICRKTRKGNYRTGDLAADWSASYMADIQLHEAQYAGADVNNFFLVVQLYGAAMQAGRSESHNKNLGVTWFRLNPDIDFRSGAVANPHGVAPAFRVEVTSGGDGRRYYRMDTGVMAAIESHNFPVHVQLWRKVS